VPLDQVHDAAEQRHGLPERADLRRDIPVVEREERDAELGQELEGRVELLGRGVEGVTADRVPRTVERPDAEHVRPGPGERMPQANGDPEVVLHALAEDDTVGLVDLERQRVGGIETLVADRLGDLGEERLAHADPSSEHRCR
jgi:hypothetical protein